MHQVTITRPFVLGAIDVAGVPFRQFILLGGRRVSKAMVITEANGFGPLRLAALSFFEIGSDPPGGNHLLLDGMRSSDGGAPRPDNR